MTLASTPRRPSRSSVIGIDVGGSRKGFDVAVLRDHRTHLEFDPLRRGQRKTDVVLLVQHERPDVVAIDSPISPALAGTRSRTCEKLLARDICGIRFTPDTQGLAAAPIYYEWIHLGLDLYDGLTAQLGPRSHDPAFADQLIEVFPTASWTRLDAPRQGTRAQWTRRILKHRLQENIGIKGVPKRHSQDARDAICAAYTAWLYKTGVADLSFWPIVVPPLRAGAPR
jgi:predicted nuclease with RNAse H fold